MMPNYAQLYQPDLPIMPKVIPADSAWPYSMVDEAARHGHAEVIKLLLEHGADVDRPDKQGVTAVQTAAENGHHECLRLLLEAGADPDGTCKANEIIDTPLHRCVGRCKLGPKVGPGGICSSFCPNFLCFIPQIQPIMLGLCPIMPNHTV